MGPLVSKGALRKRRMLWLGFVAVFVPLGVLLGLQYRWLTRLEQTSAAADKARFRNYLEAVSSDVEYFYKKQAERTLNVPVAVLVCPDPERIGHHFRMKASEGSRALFAFSLGRDQTPLVVYDPDSDRVGDPADPEMAQAIWVALAPWKTLLHKGVRLQSQSLAVDEKDPRNRIILNPIADEEATVVGVAGMVLDEEFFGQVVLPAAIERALPAFFDEWARRNLVVTARDGNARLVLGSKSEMKRVIEVERSPRFVFSDWKLILGSRYATPEQWAKSNFLLNVSMSAALAVVLLGGVVLALRTASREVRLSQMKSDFVSNVSHELRTPLASIRVFGELLRLGRVRQDDKIREYGEFIEAESRRLTQLINNILDFSRIESDAKTYDLEPSDVREIVADCLRPLELGLRHKGFRLEFHDAGDDLPPIPADADALAQALSNLVDNAVKYSNGATDITVRLARIGGEVVISVQDRGVGISRDEQGKIFDRFHRVSTGLVHDVKGSGLGLSIVRHVVQSHGGRVVVDSEPGRGSTFSIHLPVPTGARSPARELSAAPAAPMGKS